MTFLARSFTVRQGGTAYEMAGILPIDCTMVDANPSNGYRTVQYEGIKLRGYENHSSVLISLPDVPSLVAPVYGLRGAETATPFFRYKNLVAGYTHWYWGESDIFSIWTNI